VLESAFDYSQIYLKAAHNFWNRTSDIQFQIRMFAGYSTGDVPGQFLFNLGGDNSWGEFEHIFYRGRGALPWPWKRNGNLYKAGGPDVKGYSLYGFDPAGYGEKALAVNIDFRTGNPFDDFLPYVLRLISPHLFIDAGHVWNEQAVTFSSFKASAGASLSWESLDVLDYVFSLKSIRLDFPLWLSDPPSGQKNTEFRWLIRFDFE
jgi:outer membrane protein assembly factor BamA